MKHLKLFWMLLRLSIKKSMIYRADFLITIVAMFFWVGIYATFFEVIFLHIDSLAGWNKAQALMFVAFYYFVQGINNVLFRESFEGFGETMRRGQLDPILTKPGSLHLQLFFRNIRFDHLLDFLITGLLFLYIFWSNDMNLSWMDFGFGLFLSIFGNILLYGILLIMASVLFWVDRLDSFGSTMWHALQASRYPRQIFTGTGRWILQFILPIALIVSVPTEFALGAGSWNLLGYFVIISFVFLGLGMGLFHLGLKRYNSANL
jgi:ABC-2 type transport system permease protein